MKQMMQFIKDRHKEFVKAQEKLDALISKLKYTVEIDGGYFHMEDFVNYCDTVVISNYTITAGNYFYIVGSDDLESLERALRDYCMNPLYLDYAIKNIIVKEDDVTN